MRWKTRSTGESTHTTSAYVDPFGTLVAEELHEHHVSRALQLRVREFKVAEHLELRLRGEHDSEG
jgi:hypothetical protein